MRRRAQAAGFLCALLSWISGSAATARDVAGGGPIVNGVLTGEAPAVGMLLFSGSGNAESAAMICTGTLIGCHTFLTAAHCVCDTLGTACQGSNAPNPGRYFVFLQHAGVFAVQSIRVPVEFDFPVADVAVLRLATDATGIVPARINDVASPTPGSAGRIVGFGRTGGRDQSVGIKRAGNVVTAPCSAGISDTTSVCWKFLSPLGVPGSNSNTCNGDSGGPLFVDFGTGPRLAGVTSGGNQENCVLGDLSYDANVFQYRSWIEGEAGADLGASTCGSLAYVGEEGASVAMYEGVLAAGEVLPYQFEVPTGTQELRLTVNATSDFDLFAGPGVGLTETTADCVDDGVRSTAFCRFVNPTPGPWSALVKAYQSSGVYQFTVSQLTWRCADPANEGKPCNDGNDCTVGDTCQSGDCLGARVDDGTSCSDGNPCTNPDQCIAGMCIGDEEPRSGCKQPSQAAASSLVVRDPLTGKPTLSWRWNKGSSTSLAELGNPRANDGVTVCLYDSSAGSSLLVWEQAVSPGGLCTSKKPCWVKTKRGYRFRSPDGKQGGVVSVRLNSGDPGKANVSLRASGFNFAVPALPFDQDPQVVLQLTSGQTCWEARFTNNTRNSEQEFRARSD